MGTEGRRDGFVGMFQRLRGDFSVVVQVEYTDIWLDVEFRGGCGIQSVEFEMRFLFWLVEAKSPETNGCITQCEILYVQ